MNTEDFFDHIVNIVEEVEDLDQKCFDRVDDFLSRSSKSLNKEYEVHEILRSLLPLDAHRQTVPLPPVGSEYEVPSLEDWKLLNALRVETFTTGIDTNRELRKQLQSDPHYCEPLLVYMDGMIEQMMHEQPVKTWNEKKRYWKRLLKNIDVIQVNSTSKNLADPEELQALVSHKKRKVEKIEVESPSITEVHDEVTNSRKRLRRSTISGSDLLAVMTSDANKALGDVLIPLDTLLPKLMVNSPGKDSGELRELRNLKSPTQDLLRSIQKTNPAVVEISSELKKISDRSHDWLETQLLKIRSESLERFKDRWIVLCAHDPSNFTFAALPVVCDRIPNPFGSLGIDAISWGSLTCNNERQDFVKVESMPSIGNSAVSEILQVNSLLSENDGKEDRLEGIDQDNLLSEEARLCERANALWQEFSAPITENVRQQFDAMMLEFHIERALTLMSLGIDPMLVVKPLLSGRDDSVLLKSILVGSIMSRFCGKDNSNNWGPILVVCKMRDMERWEAGLSQSLAKAQLEILSYYGSDSDRISLRSYLRSLSSLGGLNSIGTGLYADRSHCHVLLMCYETLLLDMHYFKDICWFSCVFDEPWGLFSDQQYAFPSKQVTALLQARHKLFTCSNLGKRVVEQDSCELLLPDLGVVLANVFPYFSGQQKLDESTSSIVSHFDPQKPFSIHFFGGCEYIELDESSKTNLLRLLISATSVWDPAIFDRLNVGELISHDSQNVQDICGLLSIAEWNGWSLESRNLQMRPDSLIQVMVRDASTGHVSFDSQFQRESNVTYTNSFFDVEMRMELRQINLSVVGKSGPHIMRMKPLHEESSSTDRNQRHEMSLRPTGRGRGRGRGRKAKETTTSSNIEDVAASSDNVESRMKGNEGQTSQISSGRGRGRGGGRGRGRSAPLEGSSAGRGRGRGRGRGNHAGASILSTEVATAKDVLSSNHNVAKSKENHMVQHLLTESNSKDINRPSMTVEEEMMKYLVEKGGIWSSFIIASARQRFLGSFRSLVEAKAVFVAAYEQREEAKKNPSNVVKTWSKRNNRDIKLSDGAFLSDNFYETLDDKMLLEEIANILLPQSNANLFLSQWVTTHRQPPSYACLLGHEGWSVFLHHENCFLGRADDCEDSLLKDLCQQGENSVGSLPFSSSKIYPIYQISQDGSVAPEHAQLSWDTDNGAFKIRAIEPFIIYVNGKALDATKGYRKINNKDVVQIGSRSFFFLLPVSDRSVNTDIYLMKQMLLYTVLETIKIRAHFVKENAPISGIPTDSIFNHMLGLDRALQMIEEMENHVILEYSKRFDQKSFLNSGLPNDADEDVDDEPSESYTNSDRVKLQHDDADMDAALVLSSFASNGK